MSLEKTSARSAVIEPKNLAELLYLFYFELNKRGESEESIKSRLKQVSQNGYDFTLGFNTISQIKSDEFFKDEGEGVYKEVHDRGRAQQKNEVSFKSGNWYNTENSLMHYIEAFNFNSEQISMIKNVLSEEIAIDAQNSTKTKSVLKRGNKDTVSDKEKRFYLDLAILLDFTKIVIYATNNCYPSRNMECPVMDGVSEYQKICPNEINGEFVKKFYQRLEQANGFPFHHKKFVEVMKKIDEINGTKNEVEKIKAFKTLRDELIGYVVNGFPFFNRNIEEVYGEDVRKHFVFPALHVFSKDKIKESCNVLSSPLDDEYAMKFKMRSNFALINEYEAEEHVQQRKEKVATFSNFAELHEATEPSPIKNDKQEKEYLNSSSGSDVEDMNSSDNNGKVPHKKSEEQEGGQKESNSEISDKELAELNGWTLSEIGIDLKGYKAPTSQAPTSQVIKQKLSKVRTQISNFINK